MASWILRKQIPKSIPRKLIVIPPEGRAFVSGLSYSYKEYFPTEIEPYVSFDEYQRIITDINETLMTYWPCLFSLCLGYICCPFTLGLSLLIPNICIKDAEDAVRQQIKAANKETFHPKGLHMELKKGIGTSWIEIVLPDDEGYSLGSKPTLNTNDSIQERAALYIQKENQI